MRAPTHTGIKGNGTVLAGPATRLSWSYLRLKVKQKAYPKRTLKLNSTSRQLKGKIKRMIF